MDFWTLANKISYPRLDTSNATISQDLFFYKIIVFLFIFRASKMDWLISDNI